MVPSGKSVSDINYRFIIEHLNMKRYLLVILIWLVSGLAVLGGCVESSVTPAIEEPIELKVSTWGPPELPISKVNEEWAKRIEEMCGGKVKFTFYWDQSLVKASDTWKAIQTGITDIGYYVIGFTEDPELQALNGFTGLPFIGWKDMKMATDIYHEILPKFPELEAEYNGTKLLWACAMPPNQIHTANNEVRIPADYMGNKVITSGWLAELAANVGAAPVTSVGPPDWETCLKTGLADSIMVHWPAIHGYGVIPLLKYHTDFGEAGISMGMHGMWANEKRWNELPEDVKEAILSNSSWIEEEYISIDETEIANAIDEARGLGHTFSVLNEDELDEWRKAAEPITTKWLEEVEGMGLPAHAVYDEVKRLISDYGESGD
jgi:TRAP-type C4-dicarboxylate transport system substrate-binding protein